MNDLMENETVLDIGCGSGILSLAALLMGATSAYGIDIDEGALNHARENARLNHLGKYTHFSNFLPKKKKGIVLINMILSEQKTVLQQIPDLPKRASLWITSGILATQKKDALAFTSKLGLTFLEEKQQGEWIALKLAPS
jgi:ribosomal protein L11 methyltransferase